MATYNDRVSSMYAGRCNKLLSSLPSYAADYYDYLVKYNGRSTQTSLSYLHDISSYFFYIFNQNEDLTERNVPLTDLPLQRLLSVSADQISGYLCSLNLSLPAKRRKYFAISSFYRYLSDKGLITHLPTEDITDFERTHQTKSHASLSQGDIETLLNGISDNNKFLVSSLDENGQRKDNIYLIHEKAKNMRERQTLRNHAIISLMAYHGLTAPEVCSLNLDSLDGTTLSFQHANGTSHAIHFQESDPAYQSLLLYINGVEVPEMLLAEFPKDGEVYQYIFDNIYCNSDEKLKRMLIRQFGNSDPDYLVRCMDLTHYLRLSGRSSFHPSDSEHALFLSSKHSHRISQRMVQQMCVDMTRTYLPERSSIEKITQINLRDAYVSAALSSNKYTPGELADSLGTTERYIRRYDQYKRDSHAE